MGTVLLGGMSIWLGFPNDLMDIPMLVFLWPCTLVFLGLHASNYKHAFLLGWLSSITGTAIALYWLALPMHLVGGVPWFGAALCGLFVASCIATMGGFFCLSTYHTRHLPSWSQSILLALTWAFLEITYAIIAGFPWLPLAGALATSPPLFQLADIVGAHGVAALWLGAIFPIFFALPGIKQKGFAKANCYVGLSLVVLMLFYGFLKLEDRIAMTSDNITADTFPILFVEGNIDQAQKWLPEFQRSTVAHYLRLSNDGLARYKEELRTQRPLVIWPETALPYFFGQKDSLDAKILEFSKQHGVSLLFGSPAENGQSFLLKDPPVYNRAWLINGKGTLCGFYDKEHLVPFGEYVPKAFNLSFLSGLLQEVGMYTPGEITSPLRDGKLSLGMLICYEGIFPWLAQKRVADGANILVDISNDGWFLKTPAARQHLYLTALRAVEQGRYILRGTNTGISAVIDNRGCIVWHGGQFQSAAHLAWAETREELTFYHRMWPWIATCGLLLVVALFAFSRKAKRTLHGTNITSCGLTSSLSQPAATL